MLGLGADAFFVKPWMEGKMMRKLAELVDRSSKGSDGSVYADSCVLDETVEVSLGSIQMERSELLIETIQARHNNWVRWG